MSSIVVGWVNYFSIANAKTVMQGLDGFVLTRLRMGLWKEWKTCKTRVSNLLKLKVSKQKSYEWGNSSKGYCRVAHSPILCTTLNNAYKRITGETQTSLF
jgi:RNA-directed DNA polymerase